MSEPAPQVSGPEGENKGQSLLASLKSAWQLEFSGLRWSLLFGSLLARLLPTGRALGMRTSLLRAMGLDIGKGTRFAAMPKLQSSLPGPLGRRFRIGTNCYLGTNIILEFGEVLTIGDHVSVADGVVILTTTHQLGPREHRAGPVVRHPVVVGNNVVIGADSIILPGARIGDGAHVMPNSVVNASVAAGITVSGIPARPLRAV